MRIDEYLKFDGVGLANLVEQGVVTPVELLDAAVSRLEEVDQEINAVGCRFYDLARQQIADGLPSGPLRGVPFLLKDSEHKLAGTETSIGSNFLANNFAGYDSELIRRYKNTGLVIFGKSNVPELEFSTSTESRRFGMTRNPWKLSHGAGGSSGGAAAAVAAGIVPAAQGGDGGGSIRTPAAHCGVFGLKPTRGYLPFGPDDGEQRGGLSVSHVVSRSVRDSAVFLDVTAGRDLGAPYASPAPSRSFIDETMAHPHGLRIALITKPFIDTEVTPVCKQAAHQAAVLLANMGHHVEETDFDTGTDEWAAAHGVIVCGYLVMKLENWAKALGKPFRWDELEPNVSSRIKSNAPQTVSQYLNCLAAVHAVGRRLACFFQNYDIILTPATARTAPQLPLFDLGMTDAAVIDRLMLPDYCFQSLFNCAGTPAASVPWALDKSGLPVGVQLAAPFGEDGVLFQIAARIEEERPWNKGIPRSNESWPRG